MECRLGETSLQEVIRSSCYRVQDTHLYMQFISFLLITKCNYQKKKKRKKEKHKYQRWRMKFQVLVERLFKLKWLTAHEADDADLQYDEVVHSECFKHREKFAPFSKSSVMLLICFLGSFSTKNKNMSVFGGLLHHLCSFCGQSVIKRKFSINK